MGRGTVPAQERPALEGRAVPGPGRSIEQRPGPPQTGRRGLRPQASRRAAGAGGVLPALGFKVWDRCRLSSRAVRTRWLSRSTSGPVRHDPLPACPGPLRQAVRAIGSNRPVLSEPAFRIQTGLTRHGRQQDRIRASLLRSCCRRPATPTSSTSTVVPVGAHRRGKLLSEPTASPAAGAQSSTLRTRTIVRFLNSWSVDRNLSRRCRRTPVGGMTTGPTTPAVVVGQ